MPRYTRVHYLGKKNFTATRDLIVANCFDKVLARLIGDNSTSYNEVIKGICG